MITDEGGNIISGYNETYCADVGNTFYAHYIRLDGETYTKGIDACESFGAAKVSHHAQMEYGYNNSRFPNVSFVSCMITDSTGAVIMPETWRRQEEEPEE